MIWVFLISVAVTLAAFNGWTIVRWYRNRKLGPRVIYSRSRARRIRRMMRVLGVRADVAESEANRMATSVTNPGAFPKREILMTSGACLAGAIIGAIIAG